MFIAFERATGLPDRIKNRAGKFLYRIVTLLFINFQWVLFRSDGLIMGLRYIKRMFLCGHNQLADLRTAFLIKDYSAFIFCAVVFCFPVIPWGRKKLEGRPLAYAVSEMFFSVAVAALFLYAISFVVSGQNNPFAYANF